MMNLMPGKTVTGNKYLKPTFAITSIWVVVGIAIATFSITCPVLASELDDFEKASTTEASSPKKQDPKPEEKKRDEDPYRGGVFAQLFGQLVDAAVENIVVGTVHLMHEGAKMSYARVGGKTDIDPAKVELRHKGDPTLPVVQFDSKYMILSSKISAVDGCFEYGKGPFGFECRNTHFTEVTPKDDLSLTHYHLLLRMSPNRSQEYGFGIGAVKLSGNDQTSGFSMTFPMKIYSKQSVGFKFKPTYSWINGNCISDQDIALVLVKKFTTLELGYRFLKVKGERLNGSYIGFALHY